MNLDRKYILLAALFSQHQLNVHDLILYLYTCIYMYVTTSNLISSACKRPETQFRYSIHIYKVWFTILISIIIITFELVTRYLHQQNCYHKSCTTETENNKGTCICTFVCHNNNNTSFEVWIANNPAICSIRLLYIPD